MTRHAGARWLVLALLVPCQSTAGHSQSGPASLADAVRMALAIHPSLRAEGARMAAADRAIAEVRGTLGPQARVDAFGTHFQEQMVVAPLHGFNPQLPPLFDRNLVQFQATVGMTLFDGGLRRSGVLRAEASASTTAFQREVVAAGVIVEVAGGWLDVASGREFLAAQDARLSALESERDRVRQLVEVGRAAPLDALRVQAALEGAIAERVAAAQTVVSAEQSLGRLIGQPVDVVTRAAIRPLQVLAPLPAPDLLRQQARGASPEAAIAGARIAQATAGARAASSAWWPELRVVGGYTDYWSGKGRLIGEWQAGIRAGFPVFAGGSRRAASQRAALEVQAAEYARDAVVLRLETAVDHALTLVTSASARAIALTAAVTQYEEVVRIEQLALDAGAGTRRDWIGAMADLVAARSALIQAKHAQVRTRIELARLTGNLSAESLMTLLENQP